MHKEKKETITDIIALSNNDLLMGKDVVYGLEHIKVMHMSLGPRKKVRGTKKVDRLLQISGLYLCLPSHLKLTHAKVFLKLFELHTYTFKAKILCTTLVRAHIIPKK